MKKPLIIVSLACACALAANASYDSWFTGIGESASATNAMDASNGTWVFNVTNGEASVNASHKLEFDLDDGETIVFNADQAAAPDTNTVTSVAVTGVFTPVKVSDLPSDSEMNTRGAQVGFVVGNDSDTYNYYAWVGAQAGQDSGWFSIGSTINSANLENETVLTVDFDYSHRTDANNYVTFKVGGVVIGSASYQLTSTAGAAANAVAGMTCYGSGTLSAANGEVEIGIASIGNAKYASLAAAADAAQNGDTVTVLRMTTESDVTLKNGVSISDPDKKASGATIAVAANATVNVVATLDEVNNGVSTNLCTIPLNFTAGAGSTVNVTLPTEPTDVAATKEAVNVNVTGNTATFELQTKATILQAVKPDTGNSGTALAGDVAKFRAFLASDNALKAVDAAVDVSHGSLEDALQANGDNGLAKWKSYALGIKTTDPYKAVTAPEGDTETAKIKLAVPAIDGTSAWAGGSNYNVTYSVDDGSTTTTPSSAANITLEGLPAAGAGKTYTVKAVLSPKQ